MMLPYFIQVTVDYLVEKWGGRTEAVTNTLAIVLALLAIGLAVCSVTTITHTDKNGKVLYCTSVLGERTDCKD